MTVIDGLILVPLIPAAPIVVTWWLPWEKWLWDKAPKRMLGPYLCYVTFVAWHFQLHWWAVLSSAISALIVSIAAIREVTHGTRNEEP